MSLGGQKGSSSSRVRIPRFLRPMFRAGADMATDTIGTLGQLLDAGNQFVAPFNEAQQAAHIIGTDRALGGGDFFRTAQDVFMDTAEGTPISEFLPDAATSTLTQLAENGTVDPAVLERLQGVVNDGIQIPGMDTLSQIESGINGISRDALEATARGDYLYGGEGFDAAMDAAMRKIRPEILSTFGGAGPGAANGGLAKTAIAQAVADTFAGQYSTERGRQLAAAEGLAGLDFTDRGQRADISSTLANLGLAGTGTELSAADLLSRVNSSDAGTRLNAAGILGDYGNRERDRRLEAAAGLPGIAEADISLLSRIGAEQQGLEQAQIDAPIEAQLRLLSSMLGLNLNSLLGQNTNSRGIGFSIGG